MRYDHPQDEQDEVVTLTISKLILEHIIENVEFSQDYHGGAEDNLARATRQLREDYGLAK